MLGEGDKLFMLGVSSELYHPENWIGGKQSSNYCSNWIQKNLIFEFNSMYSRLVVYWLTPLAAHTLNDNPLIFWYIFDKRGH